MPELLTVYLVMTGQPDNKNSKCQNLDQYGCFAKSAYTSLGWYK